MENKYTFVPFLNHTEYLPTCRSVWRASHECILVGEIIAACWLSPSKAYFGTETASGIYLFTQGVVEISERSCCQQIAWLQLENNILIEIRLLLLIAVIELSLNLKLHSQAGRAQAQKELHELLDRGSIRFLLFFCLLSFVWGINIITAFYSRWIS